MNILILGNGFDIAHDLPTRYSDFLLFLKYIELAKNYQGTSNCFGKSLADLNDTVKSYIMDSIKTRCGGENNRYNKNSMIQEIYDCLDNNIWYIYFSQIYQNNAIRGLNWIDFENEIREVIEFFDKNFVDGYSVLPSNLSPEDCLSKVRFFFKKLDFRQYNDTHSKAEPYKNTINDLVDKTYEDLTRLIRCLEIYLFDCLGHIEIKLISPDICNLSIDCVLNFNYTHTYFNIYKSKETVACHYIHGEIRSDSTIHQNNMVLGVNEYWESDMRNIQTNFNLYKKFVQRLIKETGMDYKSWLNHIVSEYEKSKKNYSSIDEDELKTHHIYIFGHSLDVTDKDVLNEIILNPGVTTTIYYRNKEQQANQIANLSKILGQDVLLSKTFSHSPSIIFKLQQTMVPRIGLPHRHNYG